MQRPVKRFQKTNLFQTGADLYGRLLHPRDEHVTQAPADATPQHELPTSMEQLEVRQPTVELETTPMCQCQKPVSRPTESCETTEPRAKQPRLGERVYPTPLPMPIPSTPLSQRTTETVQQVGESVEGPGEGGRGINAGDNRDAWATI